MLMSERHPIVSPLIAIAFGILAVSTGSIFVRYAQVYAPSVVIAAWRLSLATLILSPIALTRNRAELRRLHSGEIKLGLLSGFFLAMHFATWISSLEYTSVASSVVFVSTAPLWVAMLSPVLLKEPLTRPILYGMGLAFMGGVIVGLSDSCNLGSSGLACPPFSEFIQGRAFLGDLLALVGAWMAAGYLIIGRRLRISISLVPYIFIVYGMAALVLIGIMLILGQSVVGYPPQVYVMFLALAVIPQLLGHSTFNWALGYLSAAYVSITLLGEPIGSALLAYFFLDEIPEPLMIFGAILILVGIYIASRGETSQKERLEST
jgi:drug/metabolite transporter (DMT)-like permease